MLLMASALSFPAAAIEFQWGEVEGSFDSQISLGSSWRWLATSSKQRPRPLSRLPFRALPEGDAH